MLTLLKESINFISVYGRRSRWGDSPLLISFLPLPELRSLARKSNRAAQRLIGLRESPERTLSVIQVGITLVGAVAAAVGGAGAAEKPVLFVADRVLSPLVTALEWSTKKILVLFFKRTRIKEPVAHIAIEIDALSPVHQTFILNMAQIENKKIREILLPWEQVNFVKESDTLEEVVQVVLRSGHTRLPVTNNGEIIGISHTKEFMALKESGEKKWQTIIRPALRVLPHNSLLGVMRLMQERRNHMTVVFSPEGQRLGIVTLEDIIEEIVGDIFDEDDDGKVRKIFASRIKSRAISDLPSK